MADCPFLEACKKIHPTHLIPDLVCEKEDLRHCCEDFCLAVLVRNRALTDYQEYVDRCVATWKRAVGSRMGVNQKEFVSRVREKGDFLRMEVP